MTVATVASLLYRVAPAPSIATYTSYMSSYDETKHTRGGNPANTGEYSEKNNSAPEGALPEPWPAPLHPAHRAQFQLRMDELFHGDEPLLFVAENPHGDGYSDAIAFDGTTAVKLTGEPDGSIFHVMITGSTSSSSDGPF